MRLNYAISRENFCVVEMVSFDGVQSSSNAVRSGVHTVLKVVKQIREITYF
jgi:hypothetical protein